MATSESPAAVRTFTDATDRGDAEAFAAAFAHDAGLDDWGRAYHGRDGVRAWDRTDNIGVRAHFELDAIEPGSLSPICLATLATVTMAPA
ncbi:hypothetical protein [Streptomyces sp. NPDC093260]|uniref:hypothetical protein n=1 Tax=Streptomyces sp. NPDC093260 TaxID=3155073 RepID=UPI0034158AFE